MPFERATQRLGQSVRVRPVVIAAALCLITGVAGADGDMPNVTMRGVTAAQVRAELVGQCIRTEASIVNNSAREVFRAECPTGDTLEIECWSGVCRRL